MGYAAIALVVGIAFILAGRWVYANPKRFFENPLYSPGEGRLTRLCGKLFGTLLIFIGAFTLVAESASMVIRRGTAVAVLATIAAVLAALLLRPQTRRGVPANLEVFPAGTARRGVPLTRKGKLFVATMVLGGLAVSAEAILLPRLGEASLWPDVAIVTVFLVAVGMLSEMLFVK